MMEMEINLHNLQVEREQLLDSIKENSLILADQLKQIDGNRCEIKKLENIIADSKKELEQFGIVFGDQRLDSTEERKKIIQEKQAALDELKGFQKDKKQLLKELSRTNQQVLSAQDELIEVRNSISNADEQLKSLLVLVGKVEQLKEQIKELSEERSKLLLHIQTEKDAHANHLLVTNTELQKAEERLSRISQECENAKTKLENYNTELTVRMYDYEVIKARLETQWNAQFPELVMPLN